MLTIKNTIWFSLLIQLITGIISLTGLLITLPDKDKILTDILGLETIVQIIEGAFYLWIAYAAKDSIKMTSRRYIDWVLTTPMMLLSTIMFMKYQEKREEESDEKIETKSFLLDNKELILKMFAYNFGMLVSGYIGEINLLPKWITTTVGFYFFYESFHLIYTNYAIKSELGKKLFNFLLVIWSMYGVAAILPVNMKNISYNLLDIVAKNFYGLYLYYKILEVSNKI